MNTLIGTCSVCGIGKTENRLFSSGENKYFVSCPDCVPAGAVLIDLETPAQIDVESN